MERLMSNIAQSLTVTIRTVPGPASASATIVGTTWADEVHVHIAWVWLSLPLAMLLLTLMFLTLIIIESRDRSTGHHAGPKRYKNDTLPMILYALDEKTIEELEKTADVENQTLLKASKRWKVKLASTAKGLRLRSVS